MTKCLVTKLKSAVNDSTLRRLGEMRITITSVESPTAGSQGFAIGFREETTLEIIGDGYFTDQNLAENKGKSITIPANVATNVFFSNGDFEIAVLNKYALFYWTAYWSGQPSSTVTRATKSHIAFSIDDLKYSKLTSLNDVYANTTGDISSLANLTSLTSLNIGAVAVTGDISSLANLTSLTSLNIEAVAVTGDISSLANLTSLTSLNIGAVAVTGDISSLANLTSLTSLNIVEAGAVTGDISSLANLTSLTSLSLKNNKNITGDLARLSSKLYFFSNQNGGITLDWSTRTNSSNIIAIEGAVRFNNLDTMLINMSNCKKAIPSSESWFKVISVRGTRTTASDSALTTLKEKGYTVVITN